MSKKLLDTLAESVNNSQKVRSSFAEKAMAKMGWEKGKGLGKEKQGNTEPIPVVKRKTNLGLGAEKGKSKWADQWWESLFNDTVKNFKVVKPRKKVKV